MAVLDFLGSITSRKINCGFPEFQRHLFPLEALLSGNFVRGVQPKPFLRSRWNASRAWKWVGLGALPSPATPAPHSRHTQATPLSPGPRLLLTTESPEAPTDPAEELPLSEPSKPPVSV